MVLNIVYVCWGIAAIATAIHTAKGYVSIVRMRDDPCDRHEWQRKLGWGEMITIAFWVVFSLCIWPLALFFFNEDLELEEELAYDRRGKEEHLPIW